MGVLHVEWGGGKKGGRGENLGQGAGGSGQAGLLRAGRIALGCPRGRIRDEGPLLGKQGFRCSGCFAMFMLLGPWCRDIFQGRLVSWGHMQDGAVDSGGPWQR